MSIKSLICLSLLSVSLAGCVTTESTTPHSSMAITLDDVTAREMKSYTECVNTALKAQYPTASGKHITANIYRGKVPGTEVDQPKAVFDIEAAMDWIQTKVKLQQQSPIDDKLTALFKSCL